MGFISKLKNKINNKINNNVNNNNDNVNVNNNDDANNLLKQQQASNEKLNALLEQSLETISCGPDCQRKKTTDDLKQKYLNAKTNIQSAPDQLETTRKNYYVYTKGEPYYDNIVEKDLIEKAESIGNLLANNFKEEISNANLMNSYYNTELTNSEYTTELYSVYLEKNQQLQKDIKDNHSDVLTNDRKTYYETEALERLTLWYTFFWYIYYFFVMPLFTITLIKKSSYNFFLKMVIEFIALAYPYYIDFVLRKIYWFFYSIWIRLPKNVYNNL